MARREIRWTPGNPRAYIRAFNAWLAYEELKRAARDLSMLGDALIRANHHAAIISSLQVVFTTVVTLAAGRPAGANLSVFAPMLEETSFVNRFLSTIDLFYVWSTFITAVGLGVLYKRRTGPIAMVLFGIYLVIALIIAFVRSGS